MKCELVECCQFFKDNMKDLPKAAEYIQERLCFGDYQSCNRYRIYKESGGEHVPFDLHPNDQEAIRKAKQCLLKKQLTQGEQPEKQPEEGQCAGRPSEEN